MRYSGGVYDIRKKCYSSFSGDMCAQIPQYTIMSRPIFHLPVVEQGTFRCDWLILLKSFRRTIFEMKDMFRDLDELK